MGAGASRIPETSIPLVAKLIMVDSGAICHRRLELPSSAAELMIEFPGRFVSLAEDLLLAGRAKAMRADEQLRPGRVYLLLNGSCRVGSRADDGLADAVKGAMKKGMPGLGAGGPRRVGSWRPVLDTIVEGN